MNRKKRKRIKQYIYAALVLVLLASTGIFWAVKLREDQSGKLEAPGAELQADTTSYAEIYAPNPMTEVREYKGEKYRYNPALVNILLLGIDESEPFEKHYVPGDAGQSDFIALVSINKRTNETNIFQIHRNTMVTNDVFNFSGRSVDKRFEQITLQYARGIGGVQSAKATEKRVSELLGDIRIDGFLALNMSGIAEIVDYLGGVDLKVSSDQTYVDPRCVPGAEIHMNGEETRHYIRVRDINEFDSATKRMQRHADFIESLLAQFRDISTDKLLKLLDTYLNVYISTDLKDSDFSAFSDSEFEKAGIIALPGRTVMGEIYEEVYIDEEGVKDIVFNYFFNKV